MFTKSQAVKLAAVAFIAAHDLAISIKARKAALLYLEAVEAYEETERINHAQMEYLCRMLNEHGIEMTEFDLIALNNLTAE